MSAKKQDSKYDFDTSKIKGNRFAFINCYDIIGDDGFRLSSPKQTIDVSKEKAIAAMKWWRRILVNPKHPCFIYDPDVLSLFRSNGRQNRKVITRLIRDQGGTPPKRLKYDKITDYEGIQWI